MDDFEENFDRWFNRLGVVMFACIIVGSIIQVWAVVELVMWVKTK